MEARKPEADLSPVRKSLMSRRFAVLPFVVTWPALLSAQESVAERILGASKDCADCRIELTKVASLPDSLIAGASIVVRDSRGRWYMASRGGGASHKKVAVFDDRGQPISVLSLKGGYNGILSVTVGSGDTLWVRDLGPGTSMRFSVFDPSLRLVKTVDRLPPLGHSGAAVLPTTGHWVVNGHYGGFPLHLLRLDGAILQSFGAVYESTDRILTLWRPFAVSHDGAIWTVEPTTYRLRSYEVREERVFGPMSVYVRQAAWIPSPKTPPGEGKRPPGVPSTKSLAFSEKDAGLLWSGTNVQWPGEPHHHIRIEAIDVRKGEVLASRRFPMNAWITQQGLVVTWRGEAPGKGWIDVFEPKLVGL